MKKMIKKLNNQRGSALLLTLGILSLVLIMAMSFAFSARTTRQVAKVNADQVKARLLAESALERVLAAMKMNYDGDEAGDVYPPEKAAGWPFQSGSVPSGSSQKYLASTDSGSDTYDLSGNESYLPILSNFATLPTVKYQAIQVGTETIGRVAFLVLEEANKLDINQMLTLRMTNSTSEDNRPFVLFDTTSTAYSGLLQSLSDHFDNSRGDFLYDITATDLTSTSVTESNTVRLGLNMQEIQIGGLYRSNLRPGFPGSATPLSAGTVAPWFSYKHLWNVAWDTALSPIVLPVSHALKYTFFSGEDIEAYWDGTDERQRFDITGFEWGSSTGDFYVTDPVNPAKFILNPARSGWYHDGTMAGAQALVDALVGDDDREVFWDTTDPTLVADSPTVGDTGFGIPYLKDLEDVTTNHGKQVAANMVDFCDGNSDATYSPADYSVDSTTAPDYCGNEAVAYFNEVALKFIGYKAPKDPSDLSLGYNFQLKLQPSIELLNIFPYEVPAANYKLKVDILVTWKPDGGTPVSLSTWSPVFKWNQAALSIGYHDLTSPELSFGTLEVPFPEVQGPAAINSTYSINITRMVMISEVSGNIVDIGFWSGTLPPVDMAIPLDGSTTLLCANWEVDDPRCNHVSNAWTCAGFTADETSFTIGAKNSCFPDPDADPPVAVPADSDFEEYSSLTFSDAATTFSTAFIPNRPFQSLWELGAIHRGERFRTINLTAYSATGGTYAAGDAAILDQVKIGPLKRTRGKFNLNSDNPAVTSVAATTTGNLLSNINVTVGYEGASSAEINTVFSPSALAAPSFSRGECATMLHYDVVGATDRQREAFIGRTANLLTTRMDKYTVLVVGEALKRIELPPGLTVTNGDSVWKTFVNPVQITIAGTPTWFSILGKQKMLAHIVRDAWRNEYEIVQMQLLED